MLLISFSRFFPRLYLLPSWALLPGSGVAIDIYIGCGALLLRFNFGYLYGGHSMTLSQNVPVLTGPCMLCDIAPPAASGIIYIYMYIYIYLQVARLPRIIHNISRSLIFVIIAFAIAIAIAIAFPSVYILLLPIAYSLVAYSLVASPRWLLSIGWVGFHLAK